MLLTSAPVAARGIATSALPLDLHVLSLSLAFILSQDQTLRCCIIVFSLLQELMKTQRSSVLVPAGYIAFKGYACLLHLPVFRNLDAGLRLFTFLVSALSIFPHCKHFNDLNASGPPAR